MKDLKDVFAEKKMKTRSDLNDKEKAFVALLKKVFYQYSRYDSLHLKADKLMAGVGGAEESMRDEDREEGREYYKRQIEEMEAEAAKLYDKAGIAYEKYRELNFKVEELRAELKVSS